nr:hypothetical protein [Tanacetum cinerariifolium]
MATTIEQQTALDESLVPSTQRLRIGISNFRLPSDIQSKEATLQVVYDVLRNSPLFRAFQVTADVPEIYMQEFWATAKLHPNSIRFKIDTRKTESAPRLFAATKGKQPSRATTPVEPTDIQRTKAEQLKLVLKRSRHETHISQQSGSGTGEGTGSKPGVPDVPSDNSEEEISWKSSDDEDVGSHKEGKKSDESDDDSDEGRDNDSDETVKSGAGKDDDDDDDEDDDDNNDEEELAKDDEEGKETGKGGDEVRESEGKNEEEEETSEEEEGSFDPIPRTPEDSEKESDDEEEQESRLSEEARIQEEEDADELYRDVNINQGRGLQVTQNVKDTHVILTPVNPDDPQETSSMSSQTNQFADAVSAIPGIVNQYMDQQMKEAI